MLYLGYKIVIATYASAVTQALFVFELRCLIAETLATKLRIKVIGGVHGTNLSLFTEHLILTLYKICYPSISSFSFTYFMWDLEDVCHCCYVSVFCCVLDLLTNNTVTFHAMADIREQRTIISVKLYFSKLLLNFIFSVQFHIHCVLQAAFSIGVN